MAMCALCGIWGGSGEWSDSATAPAVFANRTEKQTRLRERQQRTRLLNTVLKYYGVSIRDWAGSTYVLTGRTGRTAMVNSVGEIWSAVDRLGGRRCDPLDEGYLRALRELSG